LDSLDGDGLPMYATLISPGGVVLYQGNDDSDSGPWALAEGGSYGLVINASGATTGNYAFRVLDLASAAPVTLGTVLNGQLNPPLSCNLYQFHGKPGQRVSVQSLGASPNQAQWQLVTPANVVLASAQISQNLGTLTLPIGGVYTLIVSGTGNGSTALTFQVLVIDVSDTAVAATGFGTVHSGTISANQTNSFTYTGPAGLPVYFDSLDASGQVLVADLMDPMGNAVFSTGETSDAGPFVLPRSGTYTLNVRGPGGGSGNYSFRLLDLTASPTLPLSTVVSNTLATSYQTDVYQFTGTPGQRLYYDSQVGAFANVQFRVVGTDGQNVFGGSFYYDSGPQTLRFAGTNYVFLQSGVSTSTPYQFVLFDTSTQPALPLNTDLTGTLAPNVSLVYQLAGTAGEKLYFYGKSVSAGGGNCALYDGRNAQVASAGLGGDFETVLVYDSTYTVVFSGPNNTLAYSNQMSTFSASTTPLTLGTPISGNLVHPGDQVVYTFTGTPGQRVYYDAQFSGYIGMNVSLFSPTGVQVVNNNATYDFGPVTLAQAGTYALVFSGNGHTTGTINFELLDVASQPALPLNTDLTGTLPANTTILYQLAGTYGEQLYFYGKNVSAGGAGWTLYGANNVQVGSAGLGGDFLETLPYPGTFVLALQGGPNSLTYSNQVNTFSYTTNALATGTVQTPTITHPGDQAVYTFNGTAGQQLYFDSRQFNYIGINAILLSPSGVTLFNNNATYDSGGPFTLYQSGTYNLVIYGSGHTTGQVAFNLLDLAAATPVTIGGVVNDSLGDHTEARFYKFNGTAGQRVNLGSGGIGANQANWQLFGPQSQPITSSASISQNIGTVTLPVTGTYTFGVIGNGNTTGTVQYQLTITDLSDTAVASSGFGTVHSGTISANQTNSFTYTGSAGLPVFLDSQDTSGQTLVVDLTSPDGTVVFSVQETADAGPYILPRSGTYTLTVRGPNGSSGNYSLRLLDLSASPTLTLNSAVNATLNNPYETDVYEFTSTPGQALYYDAITNDASPATVYANLLDPRWQSLGPNGGPFANDRGPFAVQYGGTCYFWVRNARSSASSCAFRLLDIASQAALPINVGVTTNLDVYAANVFRYTGTAGQTLYFRGQSSNPSGYWTLFDPNNSGVSGGYASLTSDFEVTLPYSGLYSLFFISYSSTAGPETFTVNTFSYATNSYTLGVSVVGGIGLPGERQVYTFTGTVGQHLIYDALTNDPPSPSVISVSLLDPQGVALNAVSGRASTDRGPFTLGQTGTYMLVFDGNGSSTGAFAFRLVDVATLPALPISVGVTNLLDAYRAGIYSYAGTLGQRLYFRGNSANPSGVWQLFDPNDAQVYGGYSSLGGDFEVALPYDGRYVLKLDTYGTPGTEIFQVNPFNSGAVSGGLTLITVEFVGSVANVSWYSTPNKHYRLQYKNTLSDPTWTAVGGDVLATGAITVQSDPNIGANATRFYRVEALD
jgi:hypothetical protein